EEGGSHALPRDVGDHEADPLRSQVEEVVVVAADPPSLDAGSGVVERPEGRPPLRKEPRLHLLGELQLLRRPALGLPLLGDRLALRLDLLDELSSSHERERVPVQVFEARERSTPGRRMWRAMETDPAIAPFVVLRGNVLAGKDDVA